MAQPSRAVEFIGPSAAKRLADLNLSLGGMLSVVEMGETARAQATEDDPLVAAPWDAWRYRVRGLRSVYCKPPFNWTRGRDRGLEMIVSSCGRMSIITRGGDRNVGVPNTVPQPKREVGAMTAKRVTANALPFVGEWNRPVGRDRLIELARDRSIDAVHTWMLLVRPGENEEAGLVFAEMSLASGISTGDDEQDHVDGWHERVILPMIDLRGPRKSAPVPEPFDIPDVPVARKKAP